nr:PolC-type DNA polymerase III [bacterium]
VTFNVSASKKAELYNVCFTFKSLMDSKDAITFYEYANEYLEKNLKRNFNLLINYQDQLDFSNIDMIAYYNYVLNDLCKTKSRLLVLKGLNVEYADGKYIINAPESFVNFSLYTREIEKRFSILGIPIKIDVRQFKEAITEAKELEVVSEDDYGVKTVKLSESDMPKKQSSSSSSSYSGYRKEKQLTSKVVEPISAIPSDQLGLSDYENTKGPLVFRIRGEVIKQEMKTTENAKFKSGKLTILNIAVTDYTDSIAVVKYIYDDKELEKAKEIKVGSFVEIDGTAIYSSYDKDVVLKARTIELTEAPKKECRMDKSEVKRVELHVHSKMSQMDAVSEVEDYVDMAQKWGHKAIALTDHDGVYGFPHFAKACEKKGIKPIYGVELSKVSLDNILIALNEKNINLEDATFTVFDVETTGLSNQFDEIIEIGAYKLHNGKHTTSFEKLIKTERPLPNKIVELTNITNSMLEKEGEDRSVVLREFYNFIKGTILVAHNAKFDSGMIYESFKRNGIEFEEFPVIDTLQLFRLFHFNELKKFGLDQMTKFYKIQLTDHHRAKDDAYATMECFQRMLDEIYNKGVTNYNSLNKLIPDDWWKWPFGDHICLLAKNQTGYKNLFKIISDSLTVHMYNSKARALDEVIDKYHEGVLVGSACINGEIFETALNRSYDELLNKMKFYDYVEVQPISVYAHLKLGTYLDPDYRLQEAIKKIIKAADELGKIVVATSDCHYVNPEEQKYRDIYLRTKGLGGTRHPLEKFPGMTKQHLRTTDEMLDEFSFLDKDLAYEIVVTNTNKIADMVEVVQVFPKGLFDPADDEFKDSLGVPSIEAELIRMVNENAHKLYGDELPLIVKERLDKELNSIVSNKFCSVYYMAHILVKKSLEDGYLVGSRGSVGSSFVATMMNITEVNPLSPHYRCPRCKFSSFKMNEEEKEKYGIRPIEIDLQEKLKDVDSGFDLPDAICPICGTPLKKDGHDIPFETFLGFKGDKVPDIDLNFSGEYQGKAHAFIRDVMGYDNAFRAGTLQTVADKTAYGYVLGYCEDNHISMRKAEKERVANFIQGVKRTTGQHPGGIVVVPKRIEIYDVTPIQYPSDDTTNEFRTTHFEYHSFESNLLKLDILGHDDPTIIRYLMNYVNDHPQDFPFNRAQDIPVDDPNVYKIFGSTEVLKVTPDQILSEVGSLAIPEFGTDFVRQMLIDTKPKHFAELVKISGLSHGTNVWLNNAKDLVSGKKADYGKIQFSSIIGCRDDIMVDLMYMGLEPSMAFKIMEFVRKGKPKKEPANWVTHVEYMRNHGVPEWYIWSCGQIEYMFPKAHATAYVLMALRIAWFKVYKPLLFYSGYFSKRVDAFDVVRMCSDEETIRKRVLSLMDGKLEEEEELSSAKMDDHLSSLRVALEMVARGMKFKMVDINESLATEFKIIESENALLCPFVAIDGLGAAVAIGIVEERNKKPFTSISDVLSRTKINKTIAEVMDKLGCFGDLSNEAEIEDETNLFSFI